MSRDEEKVAFDPRLEDWISEREGPGEGLEPGPADPRDRELMALLGEASRARSREMSDEEAIAVLSRVRSRIAEQGRRLGWRDALLAMAAVLAGLALGLSTLPRSHSIASETGAAGPAVPETETIKSVSFESIHEGKIVRFQLELMRVR